MPNRFFKTFSKAIAVPTTHIKCDRAIVLDSHGKFSSGRVRYGRQS
ncbi:MAG: hypothetical protein RMZ69_02855 [Nostoc sp. ChiQUE01a]|nr:hypothetical protein [Nostoc sp. DedQUE01]MDZ8236107.1 hypothetical protein [Nostoc sp. ChiQUE01a]